MLTFSLHKVLVASCCKVVRMLSAPSRTFPHLTQGVVRTFTVAACSHLLRTFTQLPPTLFYTSLYSDHIVNCPQPNPSPTPLFKQFATFTGIYLGPHPTLHPPSPTTDSMKKCHVNPVKSHPPSSTHTTLFGVHPGKSPT